ncbi:transposase family protein [Pseudalkalibacillus hwajinpoensis]|uniref:transposase family protein n=1 Tax=Guptibacillus hwajinpoensis TaxID=208199 RepID=UPI00325A4C81
MCSFFEEQIFRFDEEVRILHQTQTADELFFIVEDLSTSSHCPSCDSLSNRPHSRYSRHVRDLPVSQYRVHIQIFLHKWFCDQPDCHKKVFTQRLSWLQPYKRYTERLEGVMRKIAFSNNCLTAEKVCRVLHIPVSHDTLLRLVKKGVSDVTPSPFRGHR